jgi:hypothetical protein
MTEQAGSLMEIEESEKDGEFLEVEEVVVEGKGKGKAKEMEMGKEMEESTLE